MEDDVASLFHCRGCFVQLITAIAREQDVPQNRIRQGSFSLVTLTNSHTLMVNF